MRNKHVVAAIVEDRPGVLTRVAGLFRRRGFNIDSLTVGRTEIAGMSRMTLVVDGANTVVEQVVKQLYKVIDVVKVSDITHDESIMRELVLIKVAATASARSDIIQIVEIYRAKIVDVAADSLTIEITGPPDKIESFVSLVRPYGIKEMARTGVVAMVRGAVGATQVEDQPIPIRRARGAR
ncbi:MAG: acetolactate synthase small subunit [Chloroflexota bacterium]|nr:MAG: acetolactate synthase small subunit [Chloroflexota bacterium]